MPNTTTIIVTVLMTRDNGHDITDGKLKQAANLFDIAGLDLTHDEITVHDITEGTVTRVNEWHLAATYILEVEAGDDLDGGLLEVVDECLTFQPEDGWAFVQSTCRLA
jgi:hypothetical protein